MVVDPGDATHYTADDSSGFDKLSLQLEDCRRRLVDPEMPGIGPGNDGQVYTNAAGETTYPLV